MLGVALSVYTTTSSLGSSAGMAYGFTVSAAGLGAYSTRLSKSATWFSPVTHVDAIQSPVRPAFQKEMR